MVINTRTRNRFMPPTCSCTPPETYIHARRIAQGHTCTLAQPPLQSHYQPTQSRKVYWAHVLPCAKSVPSYSVGATPIDCSSEMLRTHQDTPPGSPFCQQSSEAIFRQMLNRTSHWILDQMIQWPQDERSQQMLDQILAQSSTGELLFLPGLSSSL